MVYKYKFGNPIETDAVVVKMVEEKGPVKKLKYLDNTFIFTMDSKTRVYGLGEANRGINKRGFKYVSYCTDDPSHTEEKESLYGAHNFIIIDNENEKFGVFFDNPGRVTFDIGFTNMNEISISPEYMDMYVYIIEGNRILDIVKEFREIIGRSYIAPKWAFGFGQSRWSYENQDRVDDVVKGYEENNMLISSVYMDIDYMKDYKDFTINEERFKKFPKYVNKLKEKGIRLVPIIDAGVKIEEGYDVYEEGVKNNYFVKDEDGKDYITAVWPGLTHFPDFLNSDARKWFGDKYKTLTDMGIEGFWNDMNEPAIFYSQNKVNEIRNIIEEINSDSDDSAILDVRWKYSTLANNIDDYKAMYHNIDGQIVNHNKVHNIYGYNMSRAAGEAFERIDENKRFLMFSRASYIGMHRYSGIWMGDNCSWWSHILLNLKMLPSLNMCGFLYIGADIGGFGNNASEDLVMRWMELGVFTPLMRNHSALGTRNQECYNFEHKRDFKNILDVRYRLIPYIYSEYMKAALNGEMMFKPLAFEFEEDEMACEVEDQLLLGNIMITPVYTQNASGRYVYLPENMTFVKFLDDGNIYTEELEKGVHYIKVEVNEIPFFIRDGVNILVVKKDVIQNNKNRKSIMDCTINYSEADFETIGISKDKYCYELYCDDGISKKYSI